MARRVLLLAVAALAGLAAIAPAAGAAECAEASKRPQEGNAAEVRRAALCLVNGERAERGLNPVRMDAKLRRAATRHSRDMVRRRYFDHTAPGGATPTARATKARYLRAGTAWYLSENIAWGAGRQATPQAIVRSWMRSPPHRANILSSRVKDLGIGVAVGTPYGGRGGTYTANFGRVG